MDSKEKLIFLADWLEKNVSPERFNFASWGMGAPVENGLFRNLKAPRLAECETIGCAAGWADEAFRDADGYKCSWENNLFFNEERLIEWLEMSQEDFDIVFTDADNKLQDEYDVFTMASIPMSAVTKRIREFAEKL